MKVSIITVSYNSGKTIKDTILSVITQNYPDIEYIIVDGGSTDNTPEILKEFSEYISKVVSEPDEGIYDAMNKGLKLATGDILAFLNSDDFYADSNVIFDVVNKFKESGADIVYGDVVYVHPKNTQKILRVWRAGEYKQGAFRWGWHPPHPAFFVKRWVYEKYGGFKLKYKIAADYELMLRFMERYRVKSAYLSRILVKMRMGGVSSGNLLNIIKANIECYRALRENGINMLPFFIFMKPLRKVRQIRIF